MRHRRGHPCSGSRPSSQDPRDRDPQPHKALRPRTVQLDLRASPLSGFGVLGPNGAGKTTVGLLLVGGREAPLPRTGAPRESILAALAEECGVTAAYATPFRHALAAHVAGLTGRVRQGPGNALVVGYGNTVSALVAELAGRSAPPIGEGAFDRLSVVVVPPDGPPVLTEVRY